MTSKGIVKSAAPTLPAPNPAGGDDTAWDQHIDNVLNELMRMYRERLEPLEQRFEYDTFRPSWFSETIVQKKPFITFLGPFSAGKSTFINYLMQSNYLLTGPQPVTDKFTVIMHGDEIQQVPGRVLIADSSLPFRGLNQFGDAFAECFQGVLAPHPILRSVSLIDTPGVLEAAGDIHARRYDYVKVCRWFVEKSDLVFFLFDPTKLDAGTELRMLFKHALRGFENKIRIVLNKADTVGPQELMRVYGALFWNLSNLINTTEPPRVYVSSFWDQPYRPNTDHNLFTDEKADLLYDLTDTVPLQSLDKRVTSVLRRFTDVLLFLLVCASYKSQMPKVFGKDKARATFFAQLPELYKDLAGKYRLSDKDFPPPSEFITFINKIKTDKFYDMDELTKKGLISVIRKTIDQDLPTLLKPIKQSAVVDPRDRKHAIMLQRDYNQQLSNQLAGQQGLQGGLGQAATPIYRAQTLPNASTYSTGYGSPLSPQQSGTGYGAPSSPPAQQPAAGGGMDQMQMMQQMMQMMMQQQQQQQPPLQIAPSPEQQQQQMMMQMMMQMQQQQQQPRQ